jgi:hypothetical protein
VTVRFLVCANDTQTPTAMIKKTAKIDFFILPEIGARASLCPPVLIF